MLPELRIKRISTPNSQQEINVASDAKSVRFDVYTKDEKSRRYDIEMQIVNHHNLPKRARYYQALNSIDSYEKGGSYNYADNSYVIYFCWFDPLGYDLQQYTLQRHINELPAQIVDDGTVNIFLDVSSLKQTVNPKLQAFLELVAQRPVEEKDEFVVQLRQRIAYVKQRKKWKVKYMKLSAYEMDHRDELRAAKEEALKQGEEKGKIKGIKEMVSVLRELQVRPIKIQQTIMERFNLTNEQANQYLK